MTLDHFPHAFHPGDPSKPTILLFHGTGGDEHDLIRFGQAVAPGQTLLSPRGRVDEAGLNRWFRRHEEGVFDLEDLKFRTNELAQWLHLARVEYSLLDQPLYALGYSNGANILANLLLQGFEHLQKAAMIRPMFTDQRAPGITLPSPKTLLLVGQHDTICPPDSAEKLAEELTSKGAVVQMVRVAAGHELTQADLAEISNFLALSPGLDENQPSH